MKETGRNVAFHHLLLSNLTTGIHCVYYVCTLFVHCGVCTVYSRALCDGLTACESRLDSAAVELMTDLVQSANLFFLPGD